MGNASSMLTQYDIEEVQDHCNHLCERISIHHSKLLKMVNGLNFKEFVAFLSAFSAKASSTRKIELIFKESDSDCNGKVSFNDVLEVLWGLSGPFMSDEQREHVLTQLLKEAGYHKGLLSVTSDFVKVLESLDLRMEVEVPVD